MPGPLDYLKKAGTFLTTPLLSQESIQPIQDAIAPSAEASPMEARIRGFGQGALEGLRGLTTPADLASLVMGGGELSAARRAGALAQAAEGLPALADVAGEFSHTGSRGANAMRQAAAPLIDPTEAAYSRIMGRMGSEAGKISPEMAILGGGAMGGLAYAGKQLYNTMSNKAGELNKKLNPYERMANELDPNRKP